MAQKMIYKSVLKVEILSEDPIPSSVPLSYVHGQITNGDWSGASEWESHNTEVVGKDAADATINQGSDPEFFGMDEDGNEVEL